ncbi:MAG: archease [Candidatus Thalassarchaeum sp.]|jgi:SHS2 domain-containing protein|nr:archease [Candidatus Thalassarchaeum sp.]|tara:strand:+ start:3027 stop:3500 length:474 start_codon:yes stop_codon:yes gene_type:complete
MSWWIMPTTADIGFRVFSDSPTGILRESALALQGIQLSDRGMEYLDGHIRHVAEWSIPFGSSDIERTLVRWLEEVLFNSYVEDKWLVESEFSLDEDYLRAQVLWVDSRDVELEIEVKAVTLHDLVVRQVAMGEVVDGVEGVPSFEGPGWMAQVVLDI